MDVDRDSPEDREMLRLIWNALQSLISGDIPQKMSKSERLNQIETILNGGKYYVNILTTSSQNLLHLLCLLPLNECQFDYDELYKIATLLIKYGVDINQKDELGKTPLMLAYKNGYTSVVDALTTLKWIDLDVNTCDSSGESAFTIAGRKKDYSIYARLLTTLFRQAVATGDINTVKRFRNSSREECAIRFDDLCVNPIKRRFPNKLLVHSSYFESPIESCITFYDWLNAILLADDTRNEFMLELLFDFEKVVRATTRSGLSILHLVVSLGDNDHRYYRVFEILVDSGRVDVNALTNEEETVLHLTCRCRDPDNVESIIELLIRNKVNVNQRNSFGQTALMIACENENVAAVRKLLKWKDADGEKCDMNVKDKDGKPALNFAFVVEQVSLLNAIEKGDLETIETVFAEERLELLYDDQNPSAEKMKMSFEARRNIRGKERNILQRLVAGNFSLQIKSKRVELVATVLKSENFDVNTLTSYSQNLLHLSCLHPLNNLHCDFQESYKIAKLLLENGVNFNHKDQTGRTPLMLACENGYDSVVKALLDWNSTAFDYSGETALLMAARKKHIETFSRLSWELFLRYVKRNDIKTVTRFLNSSREQCAMGFKDLCVHQKAIRSLALLANANNSISHSVWLESVYTAHCQSSEENSHNDILQLLFNNDYYMHEPNERGQTILHSAVEEYLENKCEPKGLKKIEILLNSCKFDVNTLNSQNETILHLVCGAKAHENLLLDDLLKILLEYRVDLNLKNNFGKTALLIACENGNTNIVRTLLTLTRNNDIYLDVDAYDKPDANETVNDKRRLGQMNRVSIFNLRGEQKKWGQTYSFDFETWKEAAISAIENSFEEILKLLLDYDVVVQRQYGKTGNTILTYSIFGKDLSTKVRLKLCEKLLESGKANVNAIDFNSMTALHTISLRKNYESNAFQEFISLLLHHGINVNQKNRNGETVIASVSDSTHLRQILNFAKATGTWLDIDAKDDCDRTALMKAAMWKRSDAVIMLLNAGASVNLTDDRGFTAMHHALHEAMSHETWINYGDFPRNIQELNQRKSINIILYEREPYKFFNRNANELNEEKIEIVKLLLDSNIDVNSLDCEGYSPMDIAVATIPEIPSHIIDALKAKGAILNVFQHNNEHSEAHDNVSLLHRRANLLKLCLRQFRHESEWYMSEAEKDKMAKESFSKLSANIQNQLISARDRKGRSPLHRAIISGLQFSREKKIIESEVITGVEILISLGCSVNETDDHGRTPLHYADFIELQNLLISHGAYKTAKDENGIEAIEMSKLLVAAAEIGRDGISVIIKEIHKCIKEPKLIYLQRGKIEIQQSNIEWNKNINPDTIPKLVWEEGQCAFRHPSVNQFREEVEKFIGNLASEITKRDWRFEVTPILDGSSNEETKIGQPDEFDFLFVLKTISQLCEVTFSPELPSGFVRLKRKQSENNSITDTDFGSFFDCNSILMIEKLNAQFQISLRRVLLDAKFIENHRDFEWDLDLQTQGLLPLSNIYYLAKTLKLRNMKLDLGNRNVFHISIDIVPCIHIDGWWPDEAISSVSEEIKASGCNLVFDRPQSLYPWTQYSKSCVRISFARPESELIKRSPDAAKQAFMIAKQLISETKCRTSYILKNSFLYCIESLAPIFEKMSELRMSQDALGSKLQQMDRQFWLESLMKCHLDFVSQDFCPCYFMPNLLIPAGGVFRADLTDNDDGLFEAYRLYRSVSLHASGFDFELPAPNPLFEHSDREAMIANLRATAIEHLGNARDIYVSNETEQVEAADDNDDDEEEEEKEEENKEVEEMEEEAEAVDGY